MAYVGGAIDQGTFTPKRKFYSTEGIRTVPITVKSGQVLKAHSFLETDVAGKAIAHSGVSTKKIAGVTVYDIDASAGDVNTVMYIEAPFYMDALVWSVNVLTDTILKNDGVTTVAVTAYDTGANTNLLKRKFVEATDFQFIHETKTGEVL